MKNIIDINDFDYPLPENRIAKWPLEHRDDSKLLVYDNKKITDGQFKRIADFLPKGALMAFNNTKVVRARLIFHKSTGARIEIFCLEPADPADYERAFAVKGECSWHCMVGNSKKFSGDHRLAIDDDNLVATRGDGDIIHFTWSSDETFGQLLERLGRVPIPPYLGRESDETDTERYQTTYARLEGSVAAPTAGLHFSTEVLDDLSKHHFSKVEVTLHVGAGTFLPVKELDATKHAMHIEFFEVTLEALEALADREGEIIAVGTTTVRTLESLAVLGGRVVATGDADPAKSVGQWETYSEKSLKPLAQWMRSKGLGKLYGSTQIMITPKFRFITIRGLITNFHQPKSTLLLLISAVVGDRWREIYDHALENDYRFLSYGDSSLLMIDNEK